VNPTQNMMNTPGEPYPKYDEHPLRFPNLKKMVRGLKSQGFKTMLGVHLFANMDSKALQDGYAKGMLGTFRVRL
jgi:alpha-glucosidase (family GH31 glycosyl hydrolase)